MGAYETLAVTRIKGLWNELVDQRQVSKDLRWTEGTNARLGNVAASTTPRIPSKSASWGEINARWTDRITIAPIVGYGQRAPLKTQNVTVRLEQSNIPKIKHGTMLDEQMLIMLHRVEENIAAGLIDVSSTTDDLDTFLSYEMNQLANLRDGVLARQEHMAIGMLLNSYSYGNEHGQLFTMTWGAPSNLLVTPTNPWGDRALGINHGTAGATPFSDFWNLNTNTQQQYGFTYNRMSMSFQAFQYILGTTEFKNLAPLYMSQFGLAPTISQLPLADTARMKAIVETMMGAIIEIDDRVVMIEQNDLGNWTAPPGVPSNSQYIRFQPANKVILTNTQSDNDMSTWDLANAPIMEAKAGMVPGMIGAADGMSAANVYGPFSYATSANLNGNPPGIEMWSVKNVLPRKKELAASAVLTVF
jgi:hypothetical protein